MGNPNWSYEKMVRELDRLTTNSKKLMKQHQLIKLRRG